MYVLDALKKNVCIGWKFWSIYFWIPQVYRATFVHLPYLIFSGRRVKAEERGSKKYYECIIEHNYRVQSFHPNQISFFGKPREREREKERASVNACTSISSNTKISISCFNKQIPNILLLLLLLLVNIIIMLVKNYLSQELIFLSWRSSLSSPNFSFSPPLLPSNSTHLLHQCHRFPTISSSIIKPRFNSHPLHSLLLFMLYYISIIYACVLK